jgi:hypothetical protein
VKEPPGTGENKADWWREMRPSVGGNNAESPLVRS